MQDQIEVMRSRLRREPTDMNLESLEWMDSKLPPRRLLDGLLNPQEAPAAPVEFPLIPGQPQQVAPAPRPMAPRPARSVLKR